ncbi:dTDP-4-dehydrorhamnose reductase family protein [Micromonospora chalcea]|uniref:dTDP-4-dehydrorhamnose reductase family protein n=1 Tax=Micromonospora chalcea TaxID=1874 RepID=UPI003D70E080
MSTRLLVLGATGMLGHTLMRELSRDPDLDMRGCARDGAAVRAFFPEPLAQRITVGLDVTDAAGVRRELDRERPDVVVNCVGVIKQRPTATEPVPTIMVNALFPHLLAEACADRGIRLVQVSTDCVFSGERGGYTEADRPDPVDLYGRAKLLGETTDGTALTLRTSIIGHELQGNRSLMDWFLSQTGVVRGYTGAIYSGVTTVEFSSVLRSVVLPDPGLTGLYHLASEPISKYELLGLIADVYGWHGTVVPFDDFRCDRSMSAAALRTRTGYAPPGWPEMIRRMHEAAARWEQPRSAGLQPA